MKKPTRKIREILRHIKNREQNNLVMDTINLRNLIFFIGEKLGGK